MELSTKDVTLFILTRPVGSKSGRTKGTVFCFFLTNTELSIHDSVVGLPLDRDSCPSLFPFFFLIVGIGPLSRDIQSVFLGFTLTDLHVRGPGVPF